MASYREYVREVLDLRFKRLQEASEEIMASLKSKRFDNYAKSGQNDRAFLEGHCVGRGVDIACGHMLLADAIGVDSREFAFGADYRCRGDSLSFSKAAELDYVVTNYIEAMPDVLGAMHEWHRCLKAGGTLAIVCRDADLYPPGVPEGALSSNRRSNTFSKVTIKHYLYRAGFKEVQVTQADKSLHITAKKP
jgi:hypothetical protein